MVEKRVTLFDLIIVWIIVAMVVALISLKVIGWIGHPQGNAAGTGQGIFPAPSVEGGDVT